MGLSAQYALAAAQAVGAPIRSEQRTDDLAPAPYGELVDRLADQQSASLQHGVDLAGDPVVVVRPRRVDDLVSQPSEGRPEVRRIGKLPLQARKLDQQAIELDLFPLVAMVLRHSRVVGDSVELRRVDRVAGRMGMEPMCTACPRS